MKNILIIILTFICLNSFSQVQYKLFLNSQVKDSTQLIQNNLDKTNQIYDYVKTDSLIIFKNNALKMVLYDDRLNLFFAEEYIGTYKTKYWDCYTHIIVEFRDTGSEYFFFKLYSKDGTY